jgi:dGTP triphosphohydrolase
LNPDDELPSEYAAVMFADKIAYTTADINDAIRYEYLSEKSLLDFILNLGKTQGERTSKLVKALLDESREMGKVSFSQSSVRESFDKTRTYLFSEVYDKIDHRLKLQPLNLLTLFLKKGLWS